MHCQPPRRERLFARPPREGPARRSGSAQGVRCGAARARAAVCRAKRRAGRGGGPGESGERANRAKWCGGPAEAGRRRPPVNAARARMFASRGGRRGGPVGGTGRTRADRVRLRRALSGGRMPHPGNGARRAGPYAKPWPWPARRMVERRETRGAVPLVGGGTTTASVPRGRLRTRTRARARARARGRSRPVVVRLETAIGAPRTHSRSPETPGQGGGAETGGWWVSRGGRRRPCSRCGCRP